MSDCPWETDRDLFVEVMNHGRFFLNMQLFHDVRDRDQMKIAFDSLIEHGRVPEGWERDYTDDGRPFYWHESWPEDQTVWEHPTNRAFAEKLHACHIDLEQRPPPLPMPLPPPEQHMPLPINDPRSRSLSLGGVSAGSSPSSHSNNRSRADSAPGVDPRGNGGSSSNSSSNRSQGWHSPPPQHSGAPPGGQALWPGLGGGGESVVEHMGEHSGSGSAVDDEGEEEVLHSDRSGSNGSRGNGLELPQDTSGAHGDMDAPLNEDSDEEDELPETLHAHVPPRRGLLMEDSAVVLNESAAGGDEVDDNSGVIEFEPIDLSVLTAADGGGDGDGCDDVIGCDVVDEDDVESISPLTGVPPAGPGDDAASLVSAGLVANAAAMQPLLGGLYGVGQRVECRFGEKSKYYPGEIVEVNGDGTYKIHYDDGDRESSAREECIRALDILSCDEGEDEVADGPLVGPGLLDHAINEADNSGSVDDSQALGDETSGYEEEESSVLSESPMSPTASARAGWRFFVGQTVEAQFSGTTRYYPGVVRKINGDGTYGIQYEDGDKERSVPEAMIREVAAAAETPTNEIPSAVPAPSAPTVPPVPSATEATEVDEGAGLTIATGHRAPSLATLESNDGLVGGYSFPESGGSSALDEDDVDDDGIASTDADGVVPFSPQSSTDASMDVAAVKGFFGSGGFASTGGDGSIVNGSVAEGSIVGGSLARGSVHEDSLARSSTARGSAPDGVSADPRLGEGATSADRPSMDGDSVTQGFPGDVADSEVPFSEGAPSGAVELATGVDEATSHLETHDAQETKPTKSVHAFEEPSASPEENAKEDDDSKGEVQGFDNAADVADDDVQDVEEASMQTSEPSFDRSYDGSLGSDVISSEMQENIGPESSAPPESAPTASEPEVPPAPQAFNGLSAYQRARAAMFMSDDSGMGDDSTEGFDTNFHGDVHPLTKEPLNVVGKPLTSANDNGDNEDDEFAHSFTGMATGATVPEPVTESASAPTVTTRATDGAPILSVTQQPSVAATEGAHEEEIVEEAEVDEGERNSFDADSVASADFQESSPVITMAASATNESTPIQSNAEDRTSGNGNAVIDRATTAADVHNDDDSGSGSSIEMLADAADGDYLDNDNIKPVDNSMPDHGQMDLLDESTAALAADAPSAMPDASLAETPQSSPLYGVGQRVECRFGEKSKYYPGQIVEVNGDGTYKIHYDDGDRESSAREELIRALGEEAEPASSVKELVSAARGGENGTMEELDFEEEEVRDNAAVTEVQMLEAEDEPETGEEDKVEDFEEASSAGERSVASDSGSNGTSHGEHSNNVAAEPPPGSRPRAVVVSAARTVMSRPRASPNHASVATYSVAPVARPLASSPPNSPLPADSAPSSPQHAHTPASASRNDGHPQEAAVISSSRATTAEALANATARGHAAGKAEARLEADTATAEAVASAVAVAVEAAVKRERAAAKREAESLQDALSRAEAAAETDRVRLSRELDTQGQQVVALREQLSNLQAAGMGLDAAAALESANARLEARVQELNAAVVAARAEATAAAETSQERAIAAEAAAAEALSSAKRSDLARQAAEVAAEAAEARAGEAEARVRAKVALVAQAEEAKKLAENEAREATGKWRDLSAKAHVRNEDAIRATDAAVAACEERMKQEAASAQTSTAAAHAKAIGALQAQLVEGNEAIIELRSTKSALKAAESAAKTSSTRLLEAHAVEARLRQALDGALLEADRLQTKVSELQQDLDGFPAAEIHYATSSSGANTGGKSTTTSGSLRFELAAVRARCDELSAAKSAQEAASAKELRELRALNEALKRSCRESEEAAARRVSESENQRVASDSAARHSAAKAADATARAERAEAQVARLSSDLASMEESLEAEARQRRSDQRRSEASVVGPLREEVSALREDAEGLRVSLRAAENRNKEASKSHASEIAALQEEVRREVASLAESASSTARQEWEPRVAAAASQAALDAESKLKPSLAAAHHLSLELSDTAVSLKSQLEAQADELVEALKERDSLLAKLEQVQAEAEALRNETLPLRQVALGISAADDAAASHALNAVEQSLSLLQGECRSLLMLGPPQESNSSSHYHHHPPSYTANLPARSFTAEPSIVEVPSSQQHVDQNSAAAAAAAAPSQYPPPPPPTQPALNSHHHGNNNQSNSFNVSAYHYPSSSSSSSYNHESRAGVRALFASPLRPQARRSTYAEHNASTTAVAVDTSAELFLQGSLSRGAFAAASLDASDYEVGSSYVYGSGRANDNAFGDWSKPVGGENGSKAASAQPHLLGSSIDTGDPFESRSGSNSNASRLGRENIPPQQPPSTFMNAAPHFALPPYARTNPSPHAAPYGGTPVSVPYRPGVWRGRYA